MKTAVHLISMTMLFVLVAASATAQNFSYEPVAFQDRYIGHLATSRNLILYGYPSYRTHYRRPLSRAEFAVATHNMLLLLNARFDPERWDGTAKGKLADDFYRDQVAQETWRLEFLMREFMPELVGMGLDYSDLQAMLGRAKKAYRDVGIELRDPYTERFPDVPEGHWADAAIHNLRRAGVLYGYPDGKYRM